MHRPLAVPFPANASRPSEAAIDPIRSIDIAILKRSDMAALAFACLAACAPTVPAPEVEAPATSAADTSPSEAIAGPERKAALPPARQMELAADPPVPSPTPYGFSSGPEVIGVSVEGRPLEMHRFGYGPRERLIVAGIHGGYEWNTIALARELIAHVASHPGIIPTDVTLFFLPALNPDGEARSHSFEGRANSNGVDLSRNWDAGWRATWPPHGCWNDLPIGGGTHPGSEPEVAALLDFFGRRQIDALISYHSAALGIFAGGQPPDEASVRLADAIAAVTDYPYPPLETGCLFSGQFTDWASAQGIAAVDVELTNHRDTDLEINLGVLEVFLEWKR